MVPAADWRVNRHFASPGRRRTGPARPGQRGRLPDNGCPWPQVERLRQQLVGSDAGLEIVGDGQDNELIHADLRAQLRETVSHLFRRAGIRRWQLCWRMASP